MTTVRISKKMNTIPSRVATILGRFFIIINTPAEISNAPKKYAPDVRPGIEGGHQGNITGIKLE